MMESAEMFASNIFKSALDLIMSVSWIAITVVVLVAAVTYFFRRYTIMCIGRKLNARSDWMPFVPIACSIYELRMLHESPWKVFLIQRHRFCICAARWKYYICDIPGGN